MKTTIFALGIMLLATACNDDKVAFPETTEATLAVTGVNPVEFRTALLAFGDVEITADGQQLPATVDKALADLAKGEELSLRLPVPENAQQIEVRIAFDQYGGFDAGRYAGHIDTRGTMMKFVVPARELIDGGKAVVQLDLGRSLAGVDPERLTLLPQYTVHY